MITPADIDAFKRRVDPDVIHVGYSHQVSVKLLNQSWQRMYFLHNIDEFWRSFGRYFPDLDNGVGISVAQKELEDAIDWKGESVIIIMMRNTKKTPFTLRFYGLNAMTWWKYCEQHKTWNNHSNKDLMNGSIPAKMLVNMEK